MANPNTIYLITGANRGIGRGLTSAFLARPNTTVIAAVRDPSHPTSQSLHSLPTESSSKLIAVKIDCASPTDPQAAVDHLQDQGVTRVDVVIANAGISKDYSRVHEVPIHTLKEHIDVNALGPVCLFQAVYPLLQKSNQPTFIGVGSPLGSIGGMEMRPFPFAAYGPSKAMMHWVVRKIHFENEGFVSFVLDPGFPQTDMGNSGARAFGMEKAFQTVEEAVDGMVKIIDGASRESVGGQIRVWDGTTLPW